MASPTSIIMSLNHNQRGFVGKDNLVRQSCLHFSFCSFGPECTYTHTHTHTHTHIHIHILSHVPKIKRQDRKQRKKSSKGILLSDRTPLVLASRLYYRPSEEAHFSPVLLDPVDTVDLSGPENRQRVSGARAGRCTRSRGRPSSPV
jgi:hypothetical protein